MKSILVNSITVGLKMNMLTLTVRLRARRADTLDTSRFQGEVSAPALPPLACTPDTSDTPTKGGTEGLLVVDKNTAPAAEATPADHHTTTQFPGEIDPEVFDYRVALFTNHHVATKEASYLANRLGRRDLQSDDRRLCLECCHLGGPAESRRCTNWRVTDMRGPAIPAEMVDLLKRCIGFTAQATPASMSLPPLTVALVAGLAPLDKDDGDE